MHGNELPQMVDESCFMGVAGWIAAASTTIPHSRTGPHGDGAFALRFTGASKNLRRSV